MKQSNHYRVKQLVLQGYLNGKPRDRIALDVGVSDGKVSGIIKEWTAEIGITSIEAVREFAVTMRKSGITFRQCTEGYGIHQLLKNLGIGGVPNDENGEGHDANGEIISFMEGIFMACKDLAIMPSKVLSWIRDLLDCHNNLPSFDTGIPFVSRVSRNIAQTIEEKRLLQEGKQYLLREICDLESKRDNAQANLNKKLQKEKEAMAYIKWYHEIKKVLSDTYGIGIGETKDLAKLMHDFKHHGYDASAIIWEYNSALSIRQEIMDNERKIREIHERGTVLNNLALFYKSQMDMHRQAWHTFMELEAMGFGLNELQQLRNTISETAEANNIPCDMAVRKFLNDVEGQYNRKLGFEGKVSERSRELAHLKKEIDNKWLMLQLNPITGKALNTLFQNGLSEQDIVGINHMVQNFKNSGSGSTCPNETYSDIQGSRCSKDHENKGSEPWRVLEDELIKYGCFELSIKEQSEKLYRIKQEIQESDRQKEGAMAHCQLAISLANIINYKISYLNGLMYRHLNECPHNKIKAPSPLTPPMLVLVVYNSKSGNREKEGEEGEKQN